ncbi:mucin-2-like [Toxorhynchites rutilus septentrionalis]|uniref:mucin-2-like n=1 Tax=Toxorhynchites rutilus septentrionalis TaxID=329112 RepID=UPI00247A0EFA|nr:mucin-2-like [Toxorhynchites rutilus septentrionalis]
MKKTSTMILTLLLRNILICIGGVNAIQKQIQKYDTNGLIKSEKQQFGYPEPSIPLHNGYIYDKPSCPLTLPSTSYITIPVTETSVVVTTAAPVTNTLVQTTTELVTLPRITEFLTETKIEKSTTISTHFLTSTATQIDIHATTLTSYITTTYCAPNTYLPPEPPKNSYLPPTSISAPPSPQPPSNAQTLPVVQKPQFNIDELDVEQTTPNSFLQSFAFEQAGPIKRATKAIDENTLDDSVPADLPDLSPSSSDVTYKRSMSSPLNPSTSARKYSSPKIDIFYLESKPGGPTDLMQWLLCRFNLVNTTCLD